MVSHKQECILGHFLMKNLKKSLSMPLIKESTFLILLWDIKEEHQKNIWDVPSKNFQKEKMLLLRLNLCHVAKNKSIKVLVLENILKHV